MGPALGGGVPLDSEHEATVHVGFVLCVYVEVCM